MWYSSEALPMPTEALCEAMAVRAAQQREVQYAFCVAGQP